MSEVFLNLFTPEGSSRLGRSRLLTQNGVCHEEAFHYLLQAEAKRSQRSGQGYHILLVYRSEAQGSMTPMHTYVSSVVLDALAKSLRETDYIGWYRDGHVIGGVLTVVGQDSIADVFTRVQQRVKDALVAKLGSEESRRFHLRLCQQAELQDLESAILPMTVQ
jgi:hypothetical protein